MVGRAVAGTVVALCLLLPRGISAADDPDPDAGGPRYYEDAGSQSGPVTRELERLNRRVEELEAAQVAQEDATRSIIRQSVSQLGSKINEYITLGGTLEVFAGWSQDFDGSSTGAIQLATAELDFEVQLNDWSLASFILEYEDGSDRAFTTTEGERRSIDRVNIDTAFLTIGDTQRFPLFITGGRMIVPFGISTGDPVADVLTLGDPLTVEVFETRENAILLGIEFPTPRLTPMTPVMGPPPVQPMVVRPFFGKLARSLGYNPPPKPPPVQLPSVPPPNPPPFNLGIYFADGTINSSLSQPANHIGATAGYRSRGEGWSLDIDVDFNPSVFDSRFMEFEYRTFLDDIGFVPGMAANVQATLGPVSFVAEWNGALEHATFTDDAGNPVSIQPSAWQVSLAYQFGWNLSAESIGAQGTYLTASYSQSFELAGIQQQIGTDTTRVGNVPRQRVLVSVGEWVLDGLRLAVEYSHVIDYSKSQGGTGRSANGFIAMLTYAW